MIHLHTHSTFSVGDSVATVDQLAKTAGPRSCLAITDHNTMGGIVQFSRACYKYGTKPIFGVELDTNDAGRLTLLAKDNNGLRNLFYLLASPRTYDDLYSYRSGVVALSGDLCGILPLSILKDDHAAIKEHAGRLQSIYGENFFLEKIDHGLREQKYVNATYDRWAATSSARTVTTNDVHYVSRDDADLHLIMLCDKIGRKIDHESINYHLIKEAWLKDLPYDPVAKEISEECNAELNFGGNYLPPYPVPDGYTETEYLKHKVWAGLQEKGLTSQEYIDRARHEISIIDSMGFSGYFLIVWDFVAYAHRNGIPVGPGRGSGAGSLVAYALDITNLDPLRYDLLFERFLNPERLSMPDFDIDFGPSRRLEVIDYVVGKYKHVCQINTFGELKPRSAWKSAARVLGVSYKDSEFFSRKLPDTTEVGNTNISLDKIFDRGTVREDTPEQYKVLDKMLDNNPSFREPLGYATRMEGMYRSLGIHAAAVLIAGDRIQNYIPLWLAKNSPVDKAQTELVSQLAYEDAEQLGLVKFDFLGVNELEVIQYAVSLIEEQGIEVIDLDRIEYIHDPETFDLIATGRTLGIFQISSKGLQQFMQQMKAEKFEDIVAAVALYRPGPMDVEPKGMHLEYVDRKHGREPVIYPHDDLRDVLGDTYGIIVYQEQVMQIAQKIAGYSLGQADLLRRAMGKKKKDVMQKEYVKFMNGGASNGYNEDLLVHLWSQIETFARYGFNKSHAAAYAKIAYQTSYLKAHYTAELLAAQMQIRHSNFDEVSEFVDDARHFNIKVMDPDIQKTPKNFDVRNGVIRAGFVGIKGINHDVALRLQKSQPYQNLTDVFLSAQMNKRDAMALLKAGAFDSLLGADTMEKKRKLRAALSEQLDQFLKYSRKRRDNPGQGMLFPDLGVPFNPTPEVQWGRRELLDYEYDVLGRYVSGHPVDRYRKKAEKLGIKTIDSLEEEGESMVCAMVRDVKEHKTKNDDLMCFLLLEDETGQLDTTVFPDDYTPGELNVGDIFFFYVSTSVYEERFGAQYKNHRRPR